MVRFHQQPRLRSAGPERCPGGRGARRSRRLRRDRPFGRSGGVDSHRKRRLPLPRGLVPTTARRRWWVITAIDRVRALLGGGGGPVGPQPPAPPSSAALRVPCRSLRCASNERPVLLAGTGAQGRGRRLPCAGVRGAHILYRRSGARRWWPSGGGASLRWRARGVPSPRGGPSFRRGGGAGPSSSTSPWEAAYPALGRRVLPVGGGAGAPPGPDYPGRQAVGQPRLARAGISQGHVRGAGRTSPSIGASVRRPSSALVRLAGRCTTPSRS